MRDVGTLWHVKIVALSCFIHFLRVFLLHTLLYFLDKNKDNDNYYENYYDYDNDNDTLALG